MKMLKVSHILLLCSGVSMLLAFCSKDTLFDAGNHTLSLPFAFVSLTKQDPLSLSDTSGFATSVTVPKGTDVYFIGLASKPQQQVSMSWIFNDGQNEDTSFIVRRSFFRSGFYHAYFSIWDQAGNLMTDSVSVFVYTMPVVDAMLFPENNNSNVIASDPAGIMFRWHKTQADSGDTILSSLLLGANNAAFDTVVKNSPYQTCYYPLLPSKTYYWRVVIKSRYGGTYSSEINHFTTAKSESISKPRIISMLGDTTVKVMDTLLFFAKATDSGSNISKYSWDFNGDGVFDTTTTGDSISLCKHVYQIAATYRAGLRVSDQNGITATATITIQVTSKIQNSLPILIPTAAPVSFCKDTAYSLRLACYDADNDPVTFLWGRVPAGMSTSANGSFSWKPASSAVGIDSMVVRLTDGYGQTPDTTFYFTVKDCGQPHVPVHFTTTEQDFPTVLQAGKDTMSVLLTTDSRPQGYTLTYSARFTDRNQSVALNDASPRLIWSPVEADTGSRRLMVTVGDGAVYFDTLYPVIRVVHRNQYPCSLSWTWTGQKTDGGDLYCSGAAKTDTLYFTINDRDNILTENYSVAITRNGARSAYVINRRDFLLTIAPNSVRVLDTLNVTISDVTGSADSAKIIIHRLLDSDLVLWYKFDESSGTTAADSSASDLGRHDGALRKLGTGGNAIFTPLSKVGSHALKLTPSNNVPSSNGGYLDIGTTLSDLAPNAVTIAVWVNLADTTSAQKWARIFDFSVYNPDSKIYCHLVARAGVTNAPVRFSIYTADGYQEYIDSPLPLSQDHWHHIAIVLPSGTPYTGAMYIDGVVMATNNAMTRHPGDIGPTTSNWLGRSEYSATAGTDPFFNGSIDDFRIYRRALSATEIAELAR